MNNRLIKIIALATMVAFGCSAGLPFLATPTPPPSPVPTNTATQVPTDTPLPTDTPAPTDTPVPTDMPEPTATAAEVITEEPPGPQIYLSDDYSNPDEQIWILELISDPNLEGYEYRDGRLYLFNNFATEDAFGITQATYLDLPQDFAATVEIEFGPGASLVGEAGMVVRVGLDYSDYEFTITPEGLFSIYKYTDEFVPLVDYTESASIRIEPGAVNQLTVLANGDTLTFLINGEQVAELTDSENAGADFGLVVYNFDDIGTSAYFDNLLITSLAAYFESPPPVP